MSCGLEVVFIVLKALCAPALLIFFIAAFALSSSHYTVSTRAVRVAICPRAAAFIFPAHAVQGDAQFRTSEAG